MHPYRVPVVAERRRSHGSPAKAFLNFLCFMNWEILHGCREDPMSSIGVASRRARAVMDQRLMRIYRYVVGGSLRFTNVKLTETAERQLAHSPCE
jgi:hypothetical protein